MRCVLPVSLILVVVTVVGCDRLQQVTTPAPKQPDYFAKKRECLELATKRTARDGQAMAKHAASPDFRTGFIDLLPQQCYVPTMNTCIYESGFY